MDRDDLIRRIGALLGREIVLIGSVYVGVATFLAMLALHQRQRSDAAFADGWIETAGQVGLLAIALVAWGRASASLSVDLWLPPTEPINKHTKTQLAGALVVWFLLLMAATFIAWNLVFPQLSADLYRDVSIRFAGTRRSSSFHPYATQPQMWGLAAFSFAMVFVTLAIPISIALIRWQQRQKRRS